MVVAALMLQVLNLSEAPLIVSVVLVRWAVISVASAHAFDSTGIAAALEIPIYILPCTTHSHGLCVFQQPPLGLPPCSLQHRDHGALIQTLAHDPNDTFFFLSSC